MGRRGTLIDYWWESQKENQNAGGLIILRWKLVRYIGVMWTAWA
jgi:hypothetical protein